ncbi:MAG: carboxypeptidase-like regulatory domain-containing protein [Taibaiella sp.]|nr:carboxypeptidase-like regulatory domain-containing protein [Taibaiella sp.]
MNKIIAICIIIIACCISVVNAGVIKGKATDEKGPALAFATIYVEGTTNGTNTNGEGIYELELQPGTYVLLCQYMGFKQAKFNVTIKDRETIVHNFKLAEQGLELKEAVIKANLEDQAYGIIRKTIARRKFHLQQAKSFQTSIYLKGVLRTRGMPDKVMGQKLREPQNNLDSNGKGVLYLLEEDADYYAKDGEEHTIIHSVHESGNPTGIGISKLPPVVSFYNNNVDVIGGAMRGYISPVSDNALNYYEYKLLGQFMESGHMISKISVKGKRLYEPCFYGEIYIVEGDFAIHSLNLTLVKESGLDALDTVTLKQLFILEAADTWVIKSQVTYVTIKFLEIDITGNFISVYNRQLVNEPLPDSLFENRTVSSYDKQANKKDTSYWTEARAIPLEQDENNDFVQKDSIRKILANPARLDSIRRKGNKFSIFRFLLLGYSYTSKEQKNIFSTNSALLGLGSDCMFNYNLVEGYNIAPKFTLRHKIDSFNYLVGESAVRYGFSNRHFNAIGRLTFVNEEKAWKGKTWMGGVEGGKYVFQYNPVNPVMSWFATYSMLLFRENDLRIYERWDASAFLRRNYGNGFNWFVKGGFQRRLPLQNTTDFSILPGDQKGMKSNVTTHLLETATAWEQHNAVILTASVSYKPGITYTQYPDFKVPNRSNWPRLILSWQKGLPGLLNSKVNFDKWRFSIQDDEISLKLLGSFSYNFAVGGFLNTDYVSIPDLFHLYGNRGLGYTNPYLQGFQFAQYYEFSNNDKIYVEGHVEYHLNGLLTNKIPGFRKWQWYLVFGGNAYYGKNSEYYSEAFVGLDNIGWKFIRLLRVDFVQSWDSHMGHNSGIRFGLALNGIKSTGVGLLGTEW